MRYVLCPLSRFAKSKSGQLTTLSLSQAAILYNLKSRHVKGKPYTRTGDIVIAVNPYEWFNNLYTPERRHEYARKILWEKSDTDARNKLEPHVYETSALSYKGLALDGMNQSILVSGESGAGKTETVKIAMNHIAMVQAGPNASQHSKVSSVVQRVVESNPLLEAFGNAKTCRNDNSSRFGKYLQLQFTVGDESKISFGDRSLKDCKLAGSKSEVYLLEKSRVVHHDDTERTFHIFYQLLAAPDNVKGSFWNKLKGKTAASFNYVGATTTTSIEGKSDAQHFQDTIDALALVGIEGVKLQTLMKAISAVMQLGNVGFTGCEDKSQVSTTSELKDLAELIGVSQSVLSKAFTQRTMRTRGELVMVDLNAETAKDSCDALAKSIYHEAFLWLVREINNATKAENHNGSYTGKYGIICLLDIFGFECFRKNGFEQLCINYANEKLQQKFTEDIFRQVQAEYKFEGLALEEITYDDNHDVLDLIESRMGLLAMLNEECVRPGGNDKEFVYKAIKQNETSAALVVDKTFSPFEFGISHYAGEVLYTAGNFVTKNSDTLAADLKECAGMSSNAIIAGVPKASAAPEDNNKGFRRNGSSIAGATVWTKYKTGLQSLMGELRKTNSRYIRCIKPNEMKMPAKMQHGPTLDQLRSAGVIAAVTITRSAFPNRLDHENVLERFKHLVRRSTSVGQYEGAEGVEKLLNPLLNHMETESEQGRIRKAYAIGKTRTYFRAGALEFLEAERIKGFDPAAVVVQKAARGFLVRKRQKNAYICRRNAATKIQARARVMLVKTIVERAKETMKLSEQQNGAATVINTIARGAVRRMRFRRELKRFREVTAMKNELARLQLMVEESERLKREAVKEAEERVREAMDIFQDDQTQHSVANSVEASETARLLKDRTQLIEKMRSDNKRVRANIKLLETKYKRLREESKKLKDENDKETEKFLKMNEEAKALSAENAKGVENQEIWKKQVLAMNEEMKRTQKIFIETSDNRVKYQTTMAEIIKLLRTQCKDEQLVEDAIFIALDSDTEAKAMKAGFDALQAHKAEKQKGVSSIPTNIGKGDHTDHTEDSTSMGDDDDLSSTLSCPSLSDDEGDDMDFDDEELDRQEAEMEANLRALSAEVGI
jgi:myosin V